jgi:hypothetical protein
MSMPTNTQKYPRDGKHFKHLLSTIWRSSLPSVYTRIGTLLKSINFINIEPSDILLVF